MKLLIQTKLSKLENYFCVSKPLKRKVDIWSLVYSIFISLYIGFWVEQYYLNQAITIGVLLLISLVSFLTSSFLIRFRFLFLFILVNPLLNSLLYPINDKSIKALIILGIFLIVLFTNIKNLIKIGGLILITNIVFCCSLMVSYYSTSFLFNYSKNPPSISTVVNDKDANKDIYIIILDAFSSKEVLKKYFNCESRLLAYLGENGFQEHRSLSKYINTAQSLPNIFSGAVFDQKTAYKTKDIEQMQQLLPGRYLNNFAAKYQYQLKFSSFIIDKENNQLKKIFGRGSDFTIYFFSLTDRFMLYFSPSGKSSNNKGIHEIANQNMISIKKTLRQKAKNLSVHHFLTFHSAYFDKGFKESFIENLNEADEIGISIVQLILAKKPKAKIIILSDHAERGPEFDKKDSYKGILYIKN